MNGPSERELAEMQRALEAAHAGQEDKPKLILSATRNEYASRYESFIIRAELSSGRPVKVFCKRGPSAPPFPRSYRRGVGHEARVYAEVLRRTSVSSARYAGSYEDAENRTWLFIEHLEDVQTVNRWRGTEGMRLATDWLARFHLQSGSLAEEAPFLPRFDLAYYVFWAKRAFNFTAALHDAHPWLPTVLNMPEEVFGPLLDACPVIVHGEFYPSNVLFDGETIYPVDWECAAVGPAELDVAFLIEGWPDDVAARCLTTYEGAADGRPAISKRRLAAAEAYLAVRYLGHKPGLASWQRGPERLEILRTIADQVGAVRT